MKKEILKRQEKLIQKSRENEIEKIILGNPLSIFYFTGIHIKPYERFYGLVIDCLESIITMIHPTVDTCCTNGMIKAVSYTDQEGPENVIIKVMGTCSKIAVEKQYFSIQTGEIFAKIEASQILDIQEDVANLRMCKDEDEIKTLKEAATLVDEAIAYVKEKITIGMTEKELKMLLFSFMNKKEGFIEDDFIILVLSGENAANPHGESGERKFQEGDIILMDFCAYYKYYWSDITRCLFMGDNVSGEIKEIYEIVKHANLEAIKMVKPGVSAHEVDQKARDVIKKAGYGDKFIHRTGHGLGLSVHEEPYISESNTMILREGMVFTIEPGIYIPGIGGIRIEDDVLVTKQGCQVLTKTSKEFELCMLK